MIDIAVCQENGADRAVAQAVFLWRAGMKFAAGYDLRADIRRRIDKRPGRTVGSHCD